MTTKDSLDVCKAMLQTGLVQYGETAIDLSIEAVWAVVPEYYKWSPYHTDATRTVIKGEPGKVGELVRIDGHVGDSKPVYAETVRIRELEMIEGLYRVAGIAWKVYDEDFFSYSLFSDLALREFNGRTLLFRALYWQYSPNSSGFLSIRQELLEGRDSLVGETVKMRDQIVAYVRQRGSTAVRA
jgi:hypothetical protein